MENDKLKKFIEYNHPIFEVEVPEGLWNKIEGKLQYFENNHQRSATSKMIYFQAGFWKYAAAVLLITVIGMATYIYMMPRPTPIANVPIEKISPELADAEYYYTSQINEKQKLLKNSALSHFCTNDLKSLDSSYAQLKNELYKNINNRQISNAMIQNLQIRMKILNEQLEMLKKVKTYQNK